jgi:hypothetical protein
VSRDGAGRGPGALDWLLLLPRLVCHLQGLTEKQPTITPTNRNQPPTNRNRPTRPQL